MQAAHQDQNIQVKRHLKSITAIPVLSIYGVEGKEQVESWEKWEEGLTTRIYYVYT